MFITCSFCVINGFNFSVDFVCLSIVKMLWLRWLYLIAAAGKATCPSARHFCCRGEDKKITQGMGRSSTPNMRPLSEYQIVQKNHATKQEEYLDLGINLAVKGHRARIWKNRPKSSLLYCHLHPDCQWQSALIQFCKFAIRPNKTMFGKGQLL